MSSWHEIGQVPAFAARSLSRLHVESSSLAPQTCVRTTLRRHFHASEHSYHNTHTSKATYGRCVTDGAVQEELDGLVAMLVPERVSVSGLGEGAPERRRLPRGSSRAKGAPERRVLRRRGRVHETEDRRVSVQRDEALAELDVRDRMSYDARPGEPSFGVRRFQKSRQFRLRLGVRVDVAVVALQLEARLRERRGDDRRRRGFVVLKRRRHGDVLALPDPERAVERRHELVAGEALVLRLARDRDVARGGFDGVLAHLLSFHVAELPLDRDHDRRRPVLLARGPR